MRCDIGLLMLRLGAGATLMIHGYPTLFGGPGAISLDKRRQG